MRLKSAALWAFLASVAPPALSRRAILGATILSLAALPYEAMGQSPPPLASVTDLSVHWHFLGIGDSYTDGKHTLVCAQTGPRKYALWDPLAGRLFASSKGFDCETPTGFRKLPAQVMQQASSARPSIPVQLKKVKSGVNVYFVDDFGGRCVPNFPSSYVVVQPDGHFAEFFVIGRLRKPRVYVLDAWCDATNGARQTVQQKFEEQGSTLFNIIAPGKILLTDFRTEFLSELIILVDGLPQGVWRSKTGNTYVVPRKALPSDFDRGGGNVINRYETILATVGRYAGQ